MKQRSKILSLILALCVLGWAGQTYAVGPVAPTDDLFSKNKSTDQVKDKETPDLPYKPIEIPELEDNQNGQSTDEENLGENDGDEDLNPDEPEMKPIDWSQVPFIPSKRVELSPAPDPELE